jgi:hypothetical protein
VESSDTQPAVVRIRRKANVPQKPIRREIDSFHRIRALEFSSLTLNRDVKNTHYDVSQDFFDGVRFRHDENQPVSLRSSIHRSQDDPLSLFLEIDSMRASWICLEMDINPEAAINSDFAFLNLSASAFPKKHYAAILKLLFDDDTEHSYQISRFSLGPDVRPISASFSDFARDAVKRGRVAAAKIVLLLPSGSYVMRLKRLTYGPV